MITDIAIVEAYLTLLECDIVTEDGEPLIEAGMSYKEFVAGVTAIWQYSADIFWKRTRLRARPTVIGTHQRMRRETSQAPDFGGARVPGSGGSSD